MSNKIDVQKIAELAMLKLKEEETAQLQKNFEQILGYFEKIASIDVEDDRSDSLNENLVVYRDDNVFSSEVDISADKLSKHIENNCFTVPKVIE